MMMAKDNDEDDFSFASSIEEGGGGSSGSATVSSTKEDDGDGNISSSGSIRSSNGLSGESSDDDATTTVFGGSSSGHHHDDDTMRDTAVTRKLASKEIRTVRRMKYFVVACLLLLTCSVAIGAYYTAARREITEFETQFREDSTKLLETIGRNLLLTLSASDAFTVSLASYAHSTNQSWPYVTVADFAVRAEKIRSLANAVLVNTYMIVGQQDDDDDDDHPGHHDLYYDDDHEDGEEEEEEQRIMAQQERRTKWENYTAIMGPAQVEESINAIVNYDSIDYWPIVTNYTLFDVIYDYDEYDKSQPGTHGTNRSGPWMPMWQTQPTIAYEPPYNWDLMSVPNTATMNITSMEVVTSTKKAVITEAYLISYPNDTERLEEDLAEAEWISSYLPPDEEPMEPISDIFYPIVANANQHIEIDTTTDTDEEAETTTNNSSSSHHDEEEDKVVGIFSVSIYWRDTIRNILPEGSNGLIAVFTNPCNPSFTYEINGPEVRFLGAGDWHDSNYDHLGTTVKISEFASYASMDRLTYSGVPVDEEFCPFKLTIYPSEKTEQNHTTMTPFYFSLVTVLVFACTSLTFYFYDVWVERRQRAVMKTAVTTTKLVSSLFPEHIADKLIDTSSKSIDHANSERFSNDVEAGGKSFAAEGHQNPKRLKSFLSDSPPSDNNNHKNGIITRSATSSGGGKKHHKPLADLFPDTTVFFADIAGFTAWSSIREPAAVFTLLETLYGAFDKVAKKFGIFKVETIGDSYVAVCGLPEPNAMHAVNMARFAFETLKVMKSLTRGELDLLLGPGTNDLGLRIGLHSGPTIAGVLRGEKARFQLFGDTVNTAARMESTGISNRIQVSEKTAECLRLAGKGSWLTKREDLVNAKGKGTLQTYWLSRKSNNSTAKGSLVMASLGSLTNEDSDGRPSSSGLKEHVPVVTDPSIRRLIDWNVAIFQELLDEIVACRVAGAKSGAHTSIITSSGEEGKTVRDEIRESITMPCFNTSTSVLISNQSQGERNVTLDPKVLSQLREYITKIATFYHAENGFHNFAHCSHVIMSTIKLMQRVATPDVTKRDVITFDPLTKFAIAFSALIHDVDHQGVSNFQLAKEKDSMAVAYDNKSVLEQHSLDLSWSLLTESSFKDLRQTIYSTQEEYDRFRQLTINCVMATDIFDKELKSFRDSRWEKAFRPQEDRKRCADAIEDWNRKVTITIEFIIQASDVSHTMQHWHVYQRWNKCLFTEMMAAYKAGRADKDPSLGWYEGELWFFDNYIIPLASKLKKCDVFGVATSEFLDYATENRKEWETKGRDIVAQMVAELAAKEKEKEGSLTDHLDVADEEEKYDETSL